VSANVKKSIKGIFAFAVVIAAMLMSSMSALAADWPNSRGGPGNSGSSAETLPLPLSERWHSSAPLVEENGAVVSNGVVYMSSSEGNLYAFDVATGAVVTGFPVTTAFNFGTPAVDAVNKKVYVLAGSQLYAFNLDGTTAWTAIVGATGTNYNVGPVVEAGFVYLKAGGTLKKYDSAGILQWSVPSSGDNTQPAIMGSYVYVNTNSGQIRKYDKATGAEVTTGGFPIATPFSQAGIAVADGRIFHKADQLYAYDASTGASVWSAPAGGDALGRYSDSPAVSNGVVYVYGWDSKAYAFNEATGATMAGFPSVALSTPDDRNWSSPTVAGDKVFIGAGTSQKLKVLGAAGSGNSGVVLAEYPTFSADPQGFDLPSPVVSDGVVFAMLDGGGLYAFFTGTAPPGSITINGGAACTESRNVTLTIDPGSNTQMRISEDPLFTTASFEPVATSKAFTLSAGFGTKTVYIQFKASSGELSNVFNDQIEYSASCGGTEQPITAHGTTFSATEGASFSGKVASFDDPDTSATASEYSATIDWGDGSPTSSGTISGSGGSFQVDGTHTYTEEGSYKVTVTITDVDDSSNTATANSTANVADAALASQCAAPATSLKAYAGPTATFTDADPNGTSTDYTATIDWGDSSTSAGTVSPGTGSGPYTVSGAHAYSSTGTFTITTTINDVGGSQTVATCKTLVFAFAPGGGSFAIGDRNSATGTHVTFWGAQWWKLNSLSGGDAPAAFKGFAKNPAQPSCGTGWSTDPGNSAPPPNGPLPPDMGIIVTSKVTKSGSQISGNTPHIVVVKTDPGYQPNPGHEGTGTVEAQVC
jgi:outer membrane protein assembly factor BamB